MTVAFTDKLCPRNDSQVIYYHQIIPGSELTAYLQADHRAVSVPIERSHGGLVAAAVNHNEFPREVLLESIARYVEERLQDDRTQEQSTNPIEAAENAE